MQDLENDGPGHFKAALICIYAFCVVYNIFQIVIIEMPRSVIFQVK